MATTQKKPASGSGGAARSRQSSGGSGASGRNTRNEPARSSGARNDQKKKRSHARGIGAAVCLFLAFFGAFGYFPVSALFIDLYCGLLKGLFGYGFWLIPPALVLAAYILLFSRGRPVRLRLVFGLLVPVVIGAMLHMFLAGDLDLTASPLAVLWNTGREMKSGGVICGALGFGFARAFTKFGATVLFLLWAALMLLTAFNRTVLDVVRFIRSRAVSDDGEEELPAEEPKPRRKQKTAPAQTAPPRETPTGAAQSRRNIDIPFGEETQPRPAAAEPEPVPQPKREGFFRKQPGVPSPDQVLDRRRKESQAQTPEPPAGETEQISAARSVRESAGVVTEPQTVDSAPAEPEETVSAPVPDFPNAGIEITREPAVPKPAGRAQAAPVRTEPAAPEEPEEGDADSAAAEVSRDLENAMANPEGPHYQYPPLSLLEEGSGGDAGEALEELRANQQRLSDTIRSFGIDASIVNVTRGPSVTRYELELDQGVRLNKLTGLADDIALALGASGVRIAPIPDQVSMVGIEVPNKLVAAVHIREVIGSRAFCDHRSKVAFAVGKDIAGNAIVGDIAKMPHMLIAGTTGSGKSVCTNSLIVSLLYKATPEEVRLIMVDPKMVELSVYNGIPHLLIPVVTDPKKAAGALQWAVTEMMKRYRTFSEVGVRDLPAYNALAGRTEGMDRMPQVVVVIDELADLMMVAAKEVEESICRVAQMGRAAGMHLVIATQRPSADVITGLMKANIPSRIAFAVSSAMESRIILDTQGAEKLVGRGDMLYFPLGSGKPLRVQGCLISDQEVAAVVDFVKQSGTADYSDEIMYEIEKNAAEKDKNPSKGAAAAGDEGESDYDELLPAAIEVVVETGQASVSFLQRRLKLGYSRAARLVDQMEEQGVVGPFEGSKPRQLLITKEQWQEMKYRQNLSGAIPRDGMPAAAPGDPAVSPDDSAPQPGPGGDPV